MNVLQAFAPLSVWILRLSLVVLLFFINLQVLSHFELGQASFYISLLQILFGTLLFFGGALGRNNWTMAAGLILAILLILDLVTAYAGFTQSLVIDIMILAIALFFMSNGNKT